MDNIRKRYRIFISFITIGLSIVISFMYIYSINNTKDIYRKYGTRGITNIKKEFLKDNVNNLITKIHLKEETYKKYYKNLIENTSNILDDYYRLSADEFLDLTIKHFNKENNKDAFLLYIWDREANELVCHRNSLNLDKTNDFFREINLISRELWLYKQNTYGRYQVFFGISNNFIDSIIEKEIADEIHSLKFQNNSYIWINKVVNYKGGDNYAIRLVHPNLINTESMYLSTNTRDIKGNYPYLTELEGVKKDGEIFFNYFFKEKNSDIISEKITYAKLYKEYDWIVAMGVHLDDIQNYVDITTEDSSLIIRRMILYLLLILVFVFIISLLFYSILERWYDKNANKQLKKELLIDPLTNAYNRRAAVSDLKLKFEKFKTTGLSPAIILIDIDDFKKINDTYGHDEGDIVLKNIVGTLKSSIRSTDNLYRLGGEEFLLVCDNLKENNVIVFSNKLLKEASKIENVSGGQKYRVTISIGISYFESSDKDYDMAIKRADLALYNSKSLGKNQASIYQP